MLNKSGNTNLWYVYRYCIVFLLFLSYFFIIFETEIHIILFWFGNSLDRMITRIRLFLRHMSIIVSDKSNTWSNPLFSDYMFAIIQSSHIICCHILQWHWRFTNVPFRLIVAPTPWWPEWTMYHNTFVLSSLLLFWQNHKGSKLYDM